MKAIRTFSSSNRVSSLILFGAVALAPLPFGSTAPPVISLWCIVLGLALGAASLRTLRRSQFIPLAVMLFIAVVCAVLIAVQSFGAGIVSAENPIWERTARLLGVPVEPSVSLVRNEPIFALGAPLAAMLALATAYIVCADRRYAQDLIRVFAWSGSTYAGFAIVFFVADPTMVMWRKKSAHVSSLTTPFMNRNTAAVFFGCCAAVCLLLLLQRMTSHRDGRPAIKDVLRSTTNETPWSFARSFAPLLVCMAAMFMTGSRAGVVLSLIGMIVAFTAFFWHDLQRRRSVLIALTVAAALALVMLQTVGSGVQGRFDEYGVTDQGRMETYRSTARIIADHPWIGTGLGTFVWSFPPYRGDAGAIWGIWNRTHNTALELASELGLPLTMLIAAAWVGLMALLLRGIRQRRRDLIVPVAGFTVATIGVGHSMLDFSLQVPGFSIPVFALIGAGLAQSFSSISRPNAAAATNLP